MDENKLDQEIEKILKEVKLKEPSQEETTHFLRGVHEKIDQNLRARTLGFRQFGLVLVAGLALAGLLYLIFSRFQAETTPEMNVATARAKHPPMETVSRQPSVLKPLSIEQDMAVLEAFSEELSEESSELFGEDESLGDLAVIDELEVSITPTSQPSRI